MCVCLSIGILYADRLTKMNSACTHTHVGSAVIVSLSAKDRSYSSEKKGMIFFLKFYLASFAGEGAEMEAGCWLATHFTQLVHLQTDNIAAISYTYHYWLLNVNQLHLKIVI